MTKTEMLMHKQTGSAKTKSSKSKNVKKPKRNNSLKADFKSQTACHGKNMTDL